MMDMREARAAMVEEQIAARGVTSPHVLQAMRKVPREAFVPDGMKASAYRDSPLPIGEGQTISQPYVVALMIEAAGVEPGDAVLDVGTGSGYAAAVLGQIAGEVCSIERHPSLAEAALARLVALGCDNVRVRTGDGAAGWPKAAPFDAIIVAAAAEAVPQTLCAQLKVGGRLVIPVAADGSAQRLLVITRTADTAYETEDLGRVSFVPLVTERTG